jgi:hypothetical protein
MDVQNIGTIYSMVGESIPCPKGGETSPGSQKSNNADGLIGMDARPDISQTARTLSHLDGTLATMGQVVAKMKEHLLEIRRTLPPFQPDDAERIRILKGYFGLRKLIDELTVPHPVKSEQLKEGLNVPELSDTASDQELDAAIAVLDRTGQTIREKQGSLGTLFGL